MDGGRRLAHGSVALTVHGTAGALDLVVPPEASVDDVAREYAAQRRPAVRTGPAQPARGAASAGLVAGRPRHPQRRGARRRRRRPPARRRPRPRGPGSGAARRVLGRLVRGRRRRSRPWPGGSRPGSGGLDSAEGQVTVGLLGLLGAARRAAARPAQRAPDGGGPGLRRGGGVRRGLGARARAAARPSSASPRWSPPSPRPWRGRSTSRATRRCGCGSSCGVCAVRGHRGRRPAARRSRGGLGRAAAGGHAGGTVRAGSSRSTCPTSSSSTSSGSR